jgi:hypothetical protein
MIDDPDTFRLAKVLIDQHGGSAAMRAARPAGELLVEGDVDGAVVWRRIAEAIEGLQRGQRDDEVLN